MGLRGHGECEQKRGDFLHWDTSSEFPPPPFGFGATAFARFATIDRDLLAEP
jgi:hypothetical protein